MFIQKIKNLGWGIITVLILIASITLVVFLVKGGIYVAVKVYPVLDMVGYVTEIIDIFILLPLLMFKKTRGISAVGFLISSYIFGVTTWIYSFLVTYSIWGWVAVVIGLCLFGLGIIPLAIIATLFSGMWSLLVALIVSVLMIYGTRILALYLLNKVEKEQNMKEDDFIDEPNSDVVTVSPIIPEIMNNEEVMHELKSNPPIWDKLHRGTSFEDAIEIRGTKITQIGIMLERVYLNNMFPEYTLIEQSLSESDGQAYDTMKISTKDGVEVDVYFNVSEFYFK